MTEIPKNKKWYSHYFPIQKSDWVKKTDVGAVLGPFLIKYGPDSYGKKYFVKLHNLTKDRYAVFSRDYKRENKKGD